MTQPAKHTPLHKAIHALPMLYAEAFAGSNNREFVVELYKDAQLLETAAPAMYEALQAMLSMEKYVDQSATHEGLKNCRTIAEARQALAQAEGCKI